MKASLRALLSGVIDYAGLFPPALLSLDESIRNYARYRTQPESWMLGRFICPAAKLRELEPFLVELFSVDQPLKISALGRGGKTDEEFNPGVQADMGDMAVFRDLSHGRARIEGFETRIPLPGAFTPAGTSRDIFLEWPLGPDWRHTIELAMHVRHTGFKLRTGGVEASAFPPSEHIAFTIAMCRDNRVPLKFTAGLHHPIRHFDHTVNTRMHGFINVFAAGVLAHVGDLTEDTIVPILEDEDAGQFVFADELFRWRDCRATTQQIASVRQKYLISFGSCSFDEPRDDLRAMDWL